MMRRTLVVLGGCVLATTGPPAAASEHVRCVADEPFAVQVRESQVTQASGPARLAARLGGTGSVNCSNGLVEAPLQLEQSLALSELGTRNACFDAGADDTRSGMLRGRTELTLAISAPDGEVRRLDLRGIADGTVEVDEHDPAICRLDIGVRAQAASGASSSLRLVAVLDRASGTLVSGLMSQAELDTW